MDMFWLKECQDSAQRLPQLVREFRTGRKQADVEAQALVKSLKSTCNTCHSSYRN